MKCCIATILFIFLFLAHTIAQKLATGRNNALSIELGKNGLIYHLNYDHRLREKNFGFRLDVGSNFAQYINAFTFGGGGYYLAGSSRNFFELGVDLSYLSIEENSDDQKGFAFVYPDNTTKTYYTTMNMGYRKYGKKDLFRIGISPGLTKDGFLMGGYISYGLTF